MKIIEINPAKCRRWRYADRSAFEFGDTNALASDIKKNGQIEAVLVREIKEASPYKYEIIAGSRRHKACLDNHLMLKAIVHNVNDEQASFFQYKENDKTPICDYSKGIHIDGLVKKNITTVAKLASQLGCSKKKIYRLMRFAKVPGTVWEAVGNMTKVSSRAADTIATLCAKGDVYVQALIEIAEEIREGAGSQKIEKLVVEALHGGEQLESQRTICTEDGTIIARWKNKTLVFDRMYKVDQTKIELAIKSISEVN